MLTCILLITDQFKGPVLQEATYVMAFGDAEISGKCIQMFIMFAWSYPKKICAVKKGEPKKVQVTEWPKDVISLWGQEEKLYQLGCVYRTPAYQLSQLI